MIARIFILIILLTLLPDVYIYRRFLRHRFDLTLWQHMLWWLPGATMTACTLAYTMVSDFAPGNLTWFNIYLFLLGLIVAPKVAFVLCSLAGRLARRLFGLRRNWGNYAGVLAALAVLYVLFYGTMVGNDRLRVRRVTIEFSDLPEAFDGYRIAQLSDIHLGSMRVELLQRAVSEINSMHPDMVVFTGDIQNMRPSELTRHMPTLIHLHAPHGIYSVLGNHDYTQYVKLPDEPARRRCELMTQNFERSIDWDLLLNDRRVIHRGADSIVIAGCENDGMPPFPAKADLKKALHGIAPGAFVVMLQHDPSAWRRHILPGSGVQLTLSGHTHGGQMSILGMRPTQLAGKEDDGLYREGNRALFVSTGLGGFVPFRFHMDPEVVEITLRRSRPANR